MSIQTFDHTSNCDLEIHCSPFGLSGLYIKVEGSDSVGIGTTMARLSGSTSGQIYFNKPEDLLNSKYKLFGLLEDNDILRIDFIKVFFDKGTDEEIIEKAKNAENQEIAFENPGDEAYEIPDIVFRGKVPAGKPDAVEPFIGIFNFENPSTINE